jgi:hypothetical protein
VTNHRGGRLDYLHGDSINPDWLRRPVDHGRHDGRGDKNLSARVIGERWHKRNEGAITEGERMRSWVKELLGLEVALASAAVG